MPRIVNNADDWAATRQGIFFPAHNNTPVDGNLTGQCVTLLKWFFAEMTDVPSPFAARGDARYVGKNLVAQGLAVEVPFADRRRGDVITNEYGVYGHIYLQLSGGRVFEENANVGGAARRTISEGGESWYVYASRIGSEAEAFRRDVHVYRIKSYNEGGDMDNKVDRGGLETIWKGFLDRPPTDAEYKEYVGKGWATVLFTAITSPEYKNRYAGLVKNYNTVTFEVPKLQQRIKELEATGSANPQAVALYNAVREALK